MSTERFNMIMKLYPEEMELSKHKKELWIHQSEGDKIPAHIIKDLFEHANDLYGKYRIDNDGWIWSREPHQKVIRNFKTAGKPNMQKISGQAIWDGELSRYSRARVKRFLTDYFTPNITRQLPITLIPPGDKVIHFEFIFFRNMQLTHRLQDIDNHAFLYIKAFLDTVVLLKLIPDDSPDWVGGTYYHYSHIEDNNQRRLEVKVHFCAPNERIN